MLNSIEEAIQDIKLGRMVIVVDDEDRENEGDFICAAEAISPESINFMATHGRGLICTPITEERADELNLWPMVPHNTSMHETAFTVSIDYLREGCTTGISAYDRATGIKALTKSSTKGEDYARPGHIFPLRAKKGGVLRRVGHTEAAIDLARLAGFYPAGVLVEILNEDGTLARLPQLIELSRKHEIKIISIDDLVAYRLNNEKLVKRLSSTPLKAIDINDCVLHVFEQITTGDQHLALTIGSWEEDEVIPVRVQSSSGMDNLERFFRGNEDHSIDAILSKLKTLKKGALVLMRHQEKMNDISKLLLDLGDTSSSKSNSSELAKDIGIGAQIILDIGIRNLQLLTNSEKKHVGLDGYGIKIVGTISY